MAMSDIAGLTVLLPDPCKCGGKIAIIGAGSGPHSASLRCQSCNAHRGWMSAHTFNFINSISKKFGCPTTPIRIRRGTSPPESAPAASPAHVMERNTDMPRKHEAFPSTYYNAKDVAKRPILLTIDNVQLEPVGEGADKKDKYVCRFKEADSKLLVVTSTKWDAISLIAENDEADEWHGLKIVLQAGKTTYGGKTVDSIDIRAPKQKKPREPAKPQPAPDNDLNDEINF